MNGFAVNAFDYNYREANRLISQLKGSIDDIDSKTISTEQALAVVDLAASLATRVARIRAIQDLNTANSLAED